MSVRVDRGESNLLLLDQEARWLRCKSGKRLKRPVSTGSSDTVVAFPRAEQRNWSPLISWARSSRRHVQNKVETRSAWNHGIRVKEWLILYILISYDND